MSRFWNKALEFLTVALFALWVPLGPFLSVAGASLQSSPCCQHKSARKIGCHGSATTGASQAEAKKSCRCHKQLELRSARCGCGNHAQDLMLQADPARLSMTTVLSPAPLSHPVSVQVGVYDGALVLPERPPPIS